MYDMLTTQTIIPKTQLKYRNEGYIYIYIYDIKMWGKYYVIPFRCVKDTTLSWF